jgi:uncharacterized damage-inducible protein DinB
VKKSEILTLYDYNYWANKRVLQAAARVTPDQYGALAVVSHGSLRGALVHTYVAELVWRLRCQEGISPKALPGEAEFPTLDALVRHWREEEALMRGYLQSLGDDDLAHTVRYQTTKGVPHENILWHLLVHVVNHGTQFRAEAAVVLTQYGQSPGDLDLLLFFREQESRDR